VKVSSEEKYLPFGRPNFSDEEIAAVTRVIRSGWIGMGPETLGFERELAGFVGAPHVVTVNSCTSALFLALLLHGIGPGDEVVCPSLTWCSTANAALYLGARPVFCDVDPESLSITPETVLARVTPRTRAVMAVHMGGLAIDVDALRSQLPPGVAVVEDAAHALGAIGSDGKPVGASGNIVCFSFYANKNLSTADGGAVALVDPDQALRLCSLRQHGLAADAWQRFITPRAALVAGIAELGYKMNYTDLQAAIGRVQLRRQGEFAAVRLAIARHYAAALPAIHPGIGMQRDLCGPGHARHLFQIRLPVERLVRSRDEILLTMRTRGIGASIHYTPLHLMPLYADPGAPALPATEDLARRIMTLPISASMTITDADRVLERLAELVR